MNSQNSDFDQWITSRLKAEIPFAAPQKQLAWTLLRSKASQKAPTRSHETRESILPTNPSVDKKVWIWLKYIFSQEDTYHKAHAQSVHCHKSQGQYSGGLALQNIELIRHRWTYAA